MFRLGNITIDCASPQSQAAFWSQATGYLVKESNEFMVRLSPVDSGRPHLLFIRVPEPKCTKNRVHMDFGVSEIEAEASRLERLGATRHDAHREYGFAWIVMRDPEGNEFCIGEPDES